MATKSVRLVTYLEGLQTIKSYNALITWSCKLTWQTKPKRNPLHLYYQSAYGHQIWQDGNLPWWVPTHKVNDKLKPLLQCLWPSYLVGWWLALRSSYSKNRINLWSRGLARSCDKGKPLYLYYHSGWQDGNLPWQAPTHKITWRSRDKLKLLYLHYHGACGHQTW